MTEELAHKVDRYNGIIIDPKSLPSLESEFSQRLTASIDLWRGKGRRGVWLKLRLKQLHLAQSAVKLGFQMHHSDSKYLMLTHWLPTDEVNMLPKYSTHSVGCGGYVTNKNGDVLAVSERFSRVKGFPWKLPGGFMEIGDESISAAVEREVFEETGVEAKFVSVMFVRHLQKYQFSRPDLYFVCRLESTGENEEIRKQDSEIAQCRWIPRAEWDSYVEQVPPFLKPMFGRRSEEMGINETEFELKAERMEMHKNVWETFFVSPRSKL